MQDFAAGFSDLNGRKPMPKNARMLSASVGKMHVGALAYLLHKRGVLDLNAPLRAYLGERPWFARLPNNEDIEIQHLLNHSAGLHDHVGLPEFLQDAVPKMQSPDFYYSPEALIEFILDKEPLFPAGERFAYSDTGFLLAGLAIERAGGAPYYRLLREMLLEPMGLLSETVPADRRDIPRLVPGYLPKDNPLGLPRSTMTGGMLIRHPLNEWTGGGLADTARGLVKWSQALFEGGALDARYKDIVRNYAIAMDESNTAHYGLGVAVTTSKFGPCYGHGGWMPGYRSDVSHFSDVGLTVSLMINTDESSVMSHDGIREAVMSLAETIVRQI